MTGHIRQRSPGSWEIRYSVGTDPTTGKRRVTTVTVKGSRRDAEKELRRRLRLVDTGEHVDPNRLTVRQYLANWLAEVRPKLASRSVETYHQMIEGYLTPAFGHLRLDKLTPAHIQQVYGAWDAGGRRDGRPGGLSPALRRYLHTVFHVALARAVELQLLTRNPTDVFRRHLPKTETREIAVLDTEQTNALLAAAGELWAPIMMAVATGMRRGEVCGLRWRNVDFERRTITVVETLEQMQGSVRTKRPKGEKTRVITLPSFAAEELKKYKRQQAEALLLVGIRQTGETFVCTKADGSMLNPWSLTQSFLKLARSLGFGGIHFHSLRHGHATQLLRAGVHPRVAQERLGHANVSMTLQVYSHVTTSMQQDAADKIDETFRGKS